MKTKDIVLPDGLTLLYKEDILMLTDGSLSIFGDFTKMAGRIRRCNLGSEMLVKAARIKNKPGKQVVIDATAGLGEDAFLLAAAGFHVIMFEYNKIIYRLLEDALRRAGEDPDLLNAAADMELHFEDSITAMRSAAYTSDVVLLDPMFPERQKTALVKKKFQILQKIEQPCENGEELFKAACESGAARIVVKRPLKGPFLSEQAPSYSLKGKSIRYDCYMNSVRHDRKETR